MQLSTVISDGVLAAASLGAGWMFSRGGRYWCAVWMVAIALAAIAGTVRFSGVDGIAPLHNALSSWAAVVAFPGFCWAMTRSIYSGRDLRAGEALAIAAALNFLMLIEQSSELITTVGALALFIALIGAYKLYSSRRGAALMIGWAVALYAIAALWIGTVGSIGPLLRVDAYHYLLAIANLVFAAALWPKPRSALGRATA